MLFLRGGPRLGARACTSSIFIVTNVCSCIFLIVCTPQKCNFHSSKMIEMYEIIKNCAFKWFQVVLEQQESILTTYKYLHRI